MVAGEDVVGDSGGGACAAEGDRIPDIDAGVDEEHPAGDRDTARAEGKVVGDLERAAADDGAAGVGVGAGEDDIAGATLLEVARAGKGIGDRERLK